MASITFLQDKEKSLILTTWNYGNNPEPTHVRITTKHGEIQIEVDEAKSLLAMLEQMIGGL